MPKSIDPTMITGVFNTNEIASDVVNVIDVDVNGTPPLLYAIDEDGMSEWKDATAATVVIAPSLWLFAHAATKNKPLADAAGPPANPSRYQKALPTVLFIVGGAVACPCLVPVALSSLGFTAAGVAAGSAAAGFQSSVGVISLFSMCQSFGAVGLGTAATCVCSGVGAVAGLGIKKGLGYVRR